MCCTVVGSKDFETGYLCTGTVKYAVLNFSTRYNYYCTVVGSKDFETGY